MHIHIFTTESNYSRQFLKLFENYIDPADHIFIFRKRSATTQNYSVNLKSKIIYATNFIQFIIKAVPLIVSSGRNYLHYLPYGPSLIFWAAFPCLTKRTIWVIWGGDVYVYKNGSSSLRTRFFECLRKVVIPKFPIIASFLKEDADTAKRIYNSEAHYSPVLYPIPLDLELSRMKMKVRNHHYTNIILGNSADPSNHHIEAISSLANYYLSDIKVYCPLSYYKDSKYIDEVIAYGKKVLNDKFIPLVKFISKDEYIQFLNDMDIAIMNHDRQQALGNIIPLLYLGKKVYMRSNISTYPFFSNQGCKVFDIKLLNTSSFEEFVLMPDELRIKNKSIVEQFTKLEYCSQLWLNLFKLNK